MKRLLFLLLFAGTAGLVHAESTPVSPPQLKALATFHAPTFTATYRGGNVNTMTITGKFFSLYELLGLSAVSSNQFSDSGTAEISVFSSNGNATILLLPSLLTTNGNAFFYYTVTVSKKGVARAICRSTKGQMPSFSFTASSDTPPTAGTFSMTFVVSNAGQLPLTTAKIPLHTLQGLPNLTLQIGSAQFTAQNIKKNRAKFP